MSHCVSQVKSSQVKSSQFIHPNIHVYAQLNDIIHRRRSDQGKANNFQFHSILCILVHGRLRRVDWISSPWRGPLWPFGRFPLVIDVRFPPCGGFNSCPVGVARWICMREVWLGRAFFGRWFWVCRIFGIGVCGIWVGKALGILCWRCCGSFFPVMIH